MRPYPLPLGFVFRSRAKEEKAPADKAPMGPTKQPRDPQAPKGRPTPKRNASQTQRRSVTNTQMTRKEAGKRQRDARRADMAKQREALANGDERYLPVRDKGPVRKFARNFVDSRFCVAQWFLPMAVIILVASMMRVASLQNFALLAWLVVILLIVIDSILIAVRLKRQLVERYPNEPRRGAVMYALMRTLQMPRLRLPKPQVKRGERI
ncbi:DUF3043 domain-containing protein [Streptomyces tsukubensis]|uniref:DUF3043 domain-containing protein n=1 Tax=Streptomyces tsukubensis TaxID=83656 RepID=A0A1V4A7S7_9ACTN|nr:DUF3043 domain-containing protein [Streptomyces tsukubensis]OON77691.1 hypothetical protein B1H18_18390 [Streptomyces tsukubensis]QFR93203.1 DUF3043 domain-containing protein [Streptomyces tsukubensis]